MDTVSPDSACAGFCAKTSRAEENAANSWHDAMRSLYCDSTCNCAMKHNLHFSEFWILWVSVFLELEKSLFSEQDPEDFNFPYWVILINCKRDLSFGACKGFSLFASFTSKCWNKTCPFLVRSQNLEKAFLSEVIWRLSCILGNADNL